MAHPPTTALLHLLQLAWVKREPSQPEFTAVIAQDRNELAAWAIRHVAPDDLTLHLPRQPWPQGSDGLHAGFILVAQGQMQYEILRTQKTQTAELVRNRSATRPRFRTGRTFCARCSGGGR